MSCQQQEDSVESAFEIEPDSNLSKMLQQLSQEQEILSAAVAAKQEKVSNLEKKLGRKQLAIDEVKIEITRHRQNMMITRESISQKKKQIMVLVGEFPDVHYAEGRSDIVIGITQKSAQLALIKDKNINLGYVLDEIIREEKLVLDTISKSKEVADEFVGIRQECLRADDTLNDIEKKINCLEKMLKGRDKNELQRDVLKNIEDKEQEINRTNDEINSLSITIQERRSVKQKLKNDILISQKKSNAQIKRLTNILSELKNPFLDMP